MSPSHDHAARWMLTAGRVATDSDIIHLNLAGTPVIVVNSAQAAHDLFEKRSSLYSDRYVLRVSNSASMMTDVVQDTHAHAQ